ncbi:MAG: alpha/beta fold hydrolase [Planctomycetota bacterium]
MPRRPHKLLTVATGLVFVCTLGGCALRQLGEDLERLDRVGRVSFTVGGERFGDHPVLAALVSDEAMMLTVETYGVVPATNRLTFYCPPGDYLLVAFQDINENRRYDRSEPFAAHGHTAPLQMWSGREIDGLTLELAPPVDADAWSPAELVERGFAVSPRLTDFGSVVDLDDPRFDRDAARMGMWEPAHFIAENRAGLFLIEEYDPDKTPVVFVHGIGGSPRHFQAIIEDLDPSCQAWVFYYPSALRLQLLGDYLQLALERLRAVHHPERVVMVAHSMGGLVAWSAVRAHLRDTDEPYLDLLVTLNTPLGGMSGAAVGVDRAPVVMPSWIDLDPRSEYLAKLYDQPMLDDLRYVLFYGIGDNQTFPLPVPLRAALEGDIVTEGEDISDQTVPLASQLHPPAVQHVDAIHGYRATHMGILQDPAVVAQLNAVLTGADPERTPEPGHARP